MASESRGKALQPGHGTLASLAPHAGPPPSTLAAQLVENISASTKSSRTDENGDLKKLFAIIEKVKNQPELLSTEDERIDHNHMLIYVYARVVLDALRLDDPFADPTHFRAEAQKAIHFLKITIKETPSVLNYTAPPGTFLLRGPEPLWVWILSKVLRFLGHSRCEELSLAVEEFLQYMLVVTLKDVGLWAVNSSLIEYLREITNGRCDFFIFIFQFCF
jgi:serine/threonine-protein kinase ATR